MHIFVPTSINIHVLLEHCIKINLLSIIYTWGLWAVMSCENCILFSFFSPQLVGEKTFLFFSWKKNVPHCVYDSMSVITSWPDLFCSAQRSKTTSCLLSVKPLLLHLYTAFYFCCTSDTENSGKKTGYKNKRLRYDSTCHSVEIIIMYSHTDSNIMASSVHPQSEPDTNLNPPTHTLTVTAGGKLISTI